MSEAKSGIGLAARSRIPAFAPCGLPAYIFCGHGRVPRPLPHLRTTALRAVEGGAGERMALAQHPIDLVARLLAMAGRQARTQRRAEFRMGHPRPPRLPALEPPRLP